MAGNPPVMRMCTSAVKLQITMRHIDSRFTAHRHRDGEALVGGRLPP